MNFYDPIDHYNRLARTTSGSMTYEEQWNWLTAQQERDPDWAETESQIRKMAVEIQQRLPSTGREQQIDTTIYRPSQNVPLGLEPVRIRFVLTRCGGLEERLLIEENIRRAMYSCES